MYYKFNYKFSEQSQHCHNAYKFSLYKCMSRVFVPGDIKFHPPHTAYASCSCGGALKSDYSRAYCLSQKFVPLVQRMGSYCHKQLELTHGLFQSFIWCQQRNFCRLDSQRLRCDTVFGSCNREMQMSAALAPPASNTIPLRYRSAESL